MKNILFVISLFCCLNSYAQKDKTSSWVIQKGFSITTVDKHSFLSGVNYFNEGFIVPQSIKTLHIAVRAYSPTTGSTIKAPFAIQVKTRKKQFISKMVMEAGQFAVNIPLESMDTVAVIFIVPPPATEVVSFYLDYTICDIAKLDFTNKKPQEIFEQLLEYAATDFIDMRINSDGVFSKSKFPEGLFINNMANKYDYVIVQDIGNGLERPAADKDMVEWNNKIKGWLKEYNVTDIKRITKGSNALNTDEEETQYVKKNPKGQKLFTVTVFKQLKGDGTEADPSSYSTGIRIAK